VPIPELSEDAERLSSPESSESKDVLDGAGCDTAEATDVSLRGISPRDGGLSESEPLLEESGSEPLLEESGSESVLVELPSVEFEPGGVGRGESDVESVELELDESVGRDGVGGSDGESVEFKPGDGGTGRSLELKPAGLVGIVGLVGMLGGTGRSVEAGPLGAEGTTGGAGPLGDDPGTPPEAG